MIFISVGSREYPFNRLIKKMDELCANGSISEDVFGQIGSSDYIPEHFTYKRYLSSKEYDYYQQQANIVISHAGTGALVGALKKEKQVIAVPRRAEYGEHTDDHQLQVASVLEEKGYLLNVSNMEALGEAINHLQGSPIRKVYNEPSFIIPIIEDFIVTDIKKKKFRKRKKECIGKRR